MLHYNHRRDNNVDVFDSQKVDIEGIELPCFLKTSAGFELSPVS